MAPADGNEGRPAMRAETLLAALCGGMLVTGIVLTVREILWPPATSATPPARLIALAGRIWRGHGRTPAEQRRHRFMLGSGIVAGAAGWLFTGLPVLGLIIAVAVPGIPWLLAAGSAERRAIARVEAVGEWTRRLRDVAGTGAGLQAAVVSAATTAPPTIAEEARILAARLQAGWNGREALLAFTEDINDPVCDQIVAALLLHLKDRGDKLGAVLSSIAEASAKEVSMRKEADAERASARFSIRFMTGFSVLAIVIASFSGDYMDPYRSGTGQVVMLLLVSAFVGLLAWVRAMSRPATVPRLLAPVGRGVAR